MFPIRLDHPAEVACLQGLSEDAQSGDNGRFVSLEMCDRLCAFCQVVEWLQDVASISEELSSESI